MSQASYLPQITPKKKKEKGKGYSSRLCSSLHPQKTHLPPQRTRTRATLLARIARAVRVNVPVARAVAVATLAAGRAVACLEALLRRGADVPPQRARDGVEPLRVGAVDGRKGVLRGRNGHAVALPELHAALAVKGTVGRGAGAPGNADAQEHRVGEDHGPEGECVGADGREQDCGDVGVHKGAACGKRVGC